MANVTVILGSVVTFFFSETGFRSEFDTPKKNSPLFTVLTVLPRNIEER